ncbi:MAG TPA: hypothetical protein VFY81_15010 [Gammaproteobacteria bacterium]|nr:hypothetical protein [Gammaproteobacteria bacterium]
MAADDSAKELQMDLKGLYLEEMFTDRRVGSILRLTPVDGEGNRDSSRDIVYVGQSQILTPAGTLPLSFEIAAKTLGEAVNAFGDAARAAVDDTMERLKELRREAASSLIVPEAGGGFGGPGGPGGLGGPGGKIQLR